MRIAYLALGESWNNNSAGHSHSVSICKALAERGNKVELFIRGKGKEPSGEKFKISFVNLPSFREIKILGLNAELKKLRKKLAEFDIIQERFSVNPASILARSGSKIPVILEVNDPGIETWQGVKKMLYLPFIKMKLNSADAIITQTKTIKRMLEKQCKKPVFVVSNGAEIRKIPKTKVNKAKGLMKCKKGELRVLFVGSFREWHGVHLIPKIAKLLEEERVKFFLVGSGELLEQVKEESNGLSNIDFLGALPFEKIPALLKASDILIAPFVWENKKFDFWWSPLKLYEYLAAGKPIVSVDFPEIKKIVKDSALLAEPENTEEIAGMIAKLAENTALRKKLGLRALKIAKENSWEKRAKETLKVYNSMLGRHC